VAYGIIHRFAGATEEQYRASVAAVHPDMGNSLPAGQILHVAGKTDDGWIVIAVHDTQESWESFRDETLNPALQSGVEGGFTGPPEETTFEVVVNDHVH
jgi:hypothetical protein